MNYPRKVYLIRHENTGRIYIGSSSNPERRFSNHLYNLKSGNHPVEDMQEDFNKYGSNFTFTIIDEISKPSEAKKEYQWMKEFKSCIRGVGYNYKDHAMKNTCIVTKNTCIVTKKDLIIDEIYSLMKKTNDSELLDFILCLLIKTQKQEFQQAL